MVETDRNIQPDEEKKGGIKRKTFVSFVASRFPRSKNAQEAGERIWDWVEFINAGDGYLECGFRGTEDRVVCMRFDLKRNLLIVDGGKNGGFRGELSLKRLKNISPDGDDQEKPGVQCVRIKPTVRTQSEGLTIYRDGTVRYKNTKE